MIHRLKIIFIILGVAGSLLILVWLCLSGNGVIQWKDSTPSGYGNQHKEEVLQLKLIGQQSYWTVWYPGKDQQFGESNYQLISDSNRLGMVENDPHGKDDIFVDDSMFHLLVNHKYNISVISFDVVHEAYIPSLSIQAIAIPGMATVLNIDPLNQSEHKNLTLLCNKLCGANHQFMTMKIEVSTPSDYHKWLRSYR